jgi:chromate transporter
VERWHTNINGAQIQAVPRLRTIFLAFLAIGATSFGGGMPAYLRNSLVVKRGWLTDEEFIELLSISQALPGLNATNMAVLVGARLGGRLGAIAAMTAICMPGAVFMLVAGTVYRMQGEIWWSEAMLRGGAAAAVGLVLATIVQLGRSSLRSKSDLVFAILPVVGVHVFHLPVPIVLLGVGALSICWYRPRREVGSDR